MKYLAAWGCRRSNNIGQGWHDCLHIGPDLRLDYDEKANRTVSHFKMYFLAELLDGRHLDGRLTNLDRTKILGRTVLIRRSLPGHSTTP